MKSKSKTNQRGISLAGGVVACLIIVVVLVSGVLVFKRANKSNTASNNTGTDNTQTITDAIGQTQTALDEGWDVYTNNRYDFSFRYPKGWKVEERDPSKAFDSEATELSLWLTDVSARDYSETVAIAVIAKDITNTTPMGGDKPEYRQELSLKEKDTIKYTFPQTASVNRIMYHFAVGGRTYTIETVNEEKNIARSSDYMTKFDRIVESLQLP